MKQIQISGPTLKAVRDALRSGDDVVIFDGDVPLGRLVPIDAELKRRKDFFTHYPHDASECFNTCWRHDGHAADDEPATEDTAEPVPTG